MARLPSHRYLIQQTDGSVLLTEDGTERIITGFDPADGRQVTAALDVIRDSELDPEDTCFAAFWAGYFHSFTDRSPQLAPEQFITEAPDGTVAVTAGGAEVVTFRAIDANATSRAQKAIHDSALSADEKLRAHALSGFYYGLWCQPGTRQTHHGTEKLMPAEKPPAAEREQDWYFVFGGGHRLHASNSSGVPAGEGLSLADKYVWIWGTFMSARAEMMRLFGSCWSSQYDRAEFAGQAARYGLTELTWPGWRTSPSGDADCEVAVSDPVDVGLLDPEDMKPVREHGSGELADFDPGTGRSGHDDWGRD